jgi:hypothetical protein
MARGQQSNDAERSRAARNLIIAHGSRAAGVAETRARRLGECGEDEVAEIWRQIGVFVRAMEAGTKPTARLQPIHPCPICSLVLHASVGGQQSGAAANPRTRPQMERGRATAMQAHKYDTGDVIRETVDLEHWVGTTSHETARLIDLVVPK